MRSAGKPHSDWGYLAPAPSFMPAARMALIATVIGGIGGGVVVVSLVERPGSNDDNTAIASHPLITSAPVVTMRPVPPEEAALAHSPVQQKRAESAVLPTQAAASASITGVVANARKPTATVSPTSAPVLASTGAAEAGVPANVGRETVPVTGNPAEDHHLAATRKHWRHLRHRRAYGEYRGRPWGHRDAMRDDW